MDSLLISASAGEAETTGMDHIFLRLGHLCTVEEALPGHENETTGPLQADAEVTPLP